MQAKRAAALPSPRGRAAHDPCPQAWRQGMIEAGRSAGPGPGPASRPTVRRNDEVDSPGRAPERGGLARGWALRLLGSPALVDPDGRAHPLERRAAALLALAALEPGVTRQRLAALLWPDSDPPQARQALRQQLQRLRRLAGGLLEGDDALSLAPAVTTDLDTAGGELLGAHDYGDAEALADWIAHQRQLRGRRARDACRAAVEQAEAAGDIDAAVSAAERWLELDPHDELALRGLMRQLYLAGDSARALRLFDAFGQRLQREHATAPAAETIELAATLRAGQGRALPARGAARRAPPAALLRPPLLVGRERELAGLVSLVRERRGGWLVGEAGQGKSRLLEAVAEDAGLVVLAAARPGDANTPYASLARLLRALRSACEPGLARPTQGPPRALEAAHPANAPERWAGAADGPAGQRLALAPLLPELAAADTPLTAPAHGADLTQAVTGLLARAADAGVAALLLDDLHFADPASLDMLQTLLLAEPGVPMAWVLASRPAAVASGLAALREALDDAAAVTPVPLAPLERRALAALVGSLGLPELDAERLAPALLRHTGGNPMYVLETLKCMWLRGGRGAELPMPAPVTALIERRLRQLSAPALNLARVAAIAAVDFSIELAEQVLDMKALALADAWRELEAAQVLRGGGFAHDLVFEATLASIPAPIAAHTHAAVAAHLECAGGEPARVAGHWTAAGQPVRALAALHAAAAAAGAAMRPREQAQFLARAAAIEREAGRPDAAFGSLRQAVAAQLNSDRSDAEPALAELLALARSPEQRARALELRCEWAAARGDYAGVERSAQEALALVGEGPLRSGLLQTLGTSLSMQGRFQDAVAMLRQAQPRVEREGSADARLSFHGELAVALDNADHYAQGQAEHRKALALAFERADHANAVVIMGNLAVSLSSTGALEEATEVLMRAERLAAAHDELRGSACMTPAMLSRVLRDQARFDEALRWAEIGLREVQAQAPAWAPALQVSIATTWLQLGQHARAWQVLDQAGAPEALPAWQASAVWLARARLKRALEQGGAAEAGRALALAPTEGRRPLWAAVMLEQARHLDGGEALARVQQVHDDAQARQLHGVRLAALARLVELWRLGGELARARDGADAALELLRSAWPDEMLRSEVALHAARALHAAGQEERAAAVYADAARWVRAIAEQHVPPVARQSWLQRQAVHQALLAEAARPGRPG